MDQPIFLNACPHDPYFQWQEEVFITNARKHGISDRVHVVVWYTPDDRHRSDWTRLEQKYPEVRFFFYEDSVVDLGLYIPQLRPHSLKKHFRVMEEEYRDKVFFYHDSDIIFNRLPDFATLVEGPVCWQSNTSGYLDYTYLTNKEVQGKMPPGTIVNELARIGGINPLIIKGYDKRTGGAQYLLKGIDAAFWEDVEQMCLQIRTAFAHHVPGSINQRYFPNENEGLQSWCADMWAVNFALWKRGKITDISEELDFSWATDSVETYHLKPIFHNAGVVNGTQGLFYKGNYVHRSPLYLPHEGIKPDSASYQYVEAIRAVQQ